VIFTNLYPGLANRVHTCLYPIGKKNLKEMGDQEANFVHYCAMKDMVNLLTSKLSASLFVLSHLVFSFGIWVMIAVFLLYPPIQFWLAFFLICWFFYMIFFAPFCFISALRSFQTPAAMLYVLAWIATFVVELVSYSAQRVTPWANVYVAFFVFVKLLQSFRACTLNAIVIGAYLKHKSSIEEKPKDKQRRNAFIVYYIILANQIYMVSLLRCTFALLWGFFSFLVALLMRPLWANLFLFGRYTGLESVTLEINQDVKILNFDELQEKYLKRIKDDKR